MASSLLARSSSHSIQNIWTPCARNNRDTAFILLCASPRVHGRLRGAVVYITTHKPTQNPLSPAALMTRLPAASTVRTQLHTGGRNADRFSHVALNNILLFISRVRGRSDERRARLCVYIRPPLLSPSVTGRLRCRATMPTTPSSALHYRLASLPNPPPVSSPHPRLQISSSPLPPSCDALPSPPPLLCRPYIPVICPSLVMLSQRLGFWPLC